MNTAYIYLQIYRLFYQCVPVRQIDCGKLCGKACCKGDDCGMYLFPGEKSVYQLLSPAWAEVETSEFSYEYQQREHKVPIVFCNGECDRYQRPLACRIFPLTPILDERGKIDIIVDPRAKSICPLAKAMNLFEYDARYRKNVKKAFLLLDRNPRFHAFMQAYTAYLKDFMKFYK